MSWTLRFDTRFEKDLERLDRQVQRKIVAYLETRVAASPDPKSFGKPLSHALAGHWRYRIGDYRVVCRFEDAKLVVVAVAAGHRSVIYDR